MFAYSHGMRVDVTFVNELSLLRTSMSAPTCYECLKIICERAVSAEDINVNNLLKTALFPHDNVR